ncbi:MAG: ABC transporter permease [Lactobacillales bacterium]|jgi:ABC-2 type transport system permease protein|nr:ABC transporter permease [Lactobacillales bacterium]
MSKFWIIALDVYKKNVKNITFVIMLLAPILLVGFIYLASQLMGGSSINNTIEVVSSDPEVVQTLKSIKTDSLNFKEVKSEKAAKKTLKDEKSAGYLLVSEKSGLIEATLYTTESLALEQSMLIQQTLNQIQSTKNAEQLSLTPEQVANLSIPANLKNEHISFANDGTEKVGKDYFAIRTVISTAAVVVIFIFILTYSATIAQEIASEKGTRIMEVILSSTKAQTHFYGKLTGILLVCLTQIVAYILIGFISYRQFKGLSVIKNILSGVDFKEVFDGLFIYVIPFLIFSLLIYLFVAALCGSLVSRSEDVPKAVQPITYIAMIGYFGSIIFSTDMNNIVVKIMSYVPFLSAFAMPARLAQGSVRLPEVLISLAILIVSTILILLFSAGLYKSNVLIYNDNGLFKTLKQSLESAKIERVNHKA